MRALRWVSLSVLVTIGGAAVGQYEGSTAPPEVIRKGWETITIETLKKDLEYLAGEECAGRGTGQPGYQKAAEYVAKRFKESGLKPIGDNGTYFQNLTFERSRINPLQSALQVGSDIRILGYNTLRLEGSSVDTKVEGPLMIVRARGAQAKLENADSLKDAVVVLAAEGIGQELRRQLLLAGAKAVITVQPKVTEANWVVRRAGRGPAGGPTRPGNLRGSLSKTAAEQLAKAVGQPESIVHASDLGESQAIIVSTGKLATVDAKVEKEQVLVPNVVGLLEGSDPKLKEEVVAIGAHLDHLGEVNGQIYYGADDDGSGSAALLAIANALHQNPVKPKRSILFLAFCAEEMGLIGSAYYVNNPLIPLEKTICLLQMDMIGRNEEHGDEKASENIDTIHLVGSKRISTELHQSILDANRFVNLKFEYDEEAVYTRSDHYMFAQKGIPIAFFFSGFHPDYHQPTDTIEKINFDKMRATARLVFVTAFGAANRTKPFERDVKG
jgi:hypothetical protein